MTKVTYIVTPKSKKEAPFEVKTLKEAIVATMGRTKGDYKIKYTRIEEDLSKQRQGPWTPPRGPHVAKKVVDKCFLMCYNKDTKKEKR